MRWQYRDPTLVWLLIVAYAAHLIEEWLGGFPEWLGIVAGRPLPRGGFIVINAVALTAAIAGTIAATRRESNGWMVIAIATVLAVNGVAHVLGSLATGTYSPGLFTGVILYLPLGQLLLLRAWHQAPRRLFGRGVLTGVALHALLLPVALAFTRMG